MSELRDYANEINKCSHCGLCQTVCPKYRETLNECDSAGGKITMLAGVLSGDIKNNNVINSYLKQCEGCNLCESACPAGIKIKEIFKCATNSL